MQVCRAHCILSTSEVQVCRAGGAHVLVRDPEDAAGPLAFLPKIPLNSTLTEFCFALALVHWNSTELLLIEKFRDFAGVEFKLRRRRRREGGEQRWGPLAELFFFLDLEKGRGKDEGARYYYR